MVPQQIVTYRTNGHWNVMIHAANGALRIFTDLIADLALAIVRLFQKKGASIAEMAGKRFLSLMLDATI